jgi:hypothetical protein
VFLTDIRAYLEVRWRAWLAAFSGRRGGGGAPLGVVQDRVLFRPASEGGLVVDRLLDGLKRQHAGGGGQRADQRRRDADPDLAALARALGGHAVVGQLPEVADEHPGAPADLLGQGDGVDHHQLAQLGEHRLGQEAQQVLGVTGGVDHQHALPVGGAPEEVDPLDERLLDQDDPVGVGVLVHEAVDDGLVTEPRVLADEAVGAVGVVDVVADVVREEAGVAGGGGHAVDDVPGFLVHDDAAGPDRDLVVHVSSFRRP